MEFIQNREGLVATLTVKISQADYAAKVDKELKKLRQTSQIKGFRPGNAPMHLMRKMFEQNILLDEINKIIQEVISKYEQENQNDLICPVIPDDKLSIANQDAQKDFEFVYKACFYPEFTYRIDENTEVAYYNISVTENDVEEEVNSFRNRFCSLEKTDVIEENCSVTVSIRPVNEGEENTISTFSISQISEECKPLFLGAKENDEINVEIRKAFNETDLTGLLKTDKEKLELQPETLLFTIVEISKTIPAKLDQEFFDKFEGKTMIHNEAELREFLKKRVTSEYQKLSLDKLYLDSIKIIKEKANVQLPEDLIVKYLRLSQKENAEVSETKFASLSKSFIESTKLKFILNSILHQLNAVITTEMVKEETKEYLIKKGYSQSGHDMDQLVDYYLNDSEILTYIIDRIKVKKFSEAVKANAKLNVIDVNFEEFYMLYGDQNAEIDKSPESPATEIENRELAVEESATENVETTNNIKSEK
jgi:trigger factor